MSESRPWPLEPKVVVLPDPDGRTFPDDLDPGDMVFDEQGTPILEWNDHYPRFGPCRVLSYLEPGGDGVETHPIGAGLDNVDWALEHLRMVAKEGDDDD